MADRTPSTSGARRAIIAFLAIGYGAFLAFVVFWPSPIDKPVAAQLSKAIALMHRHGVPAFVDYGFIEFTANIALFIPVGLLFGLMIPLRWWPVALVLGPLLSAGIEFAQGMLLSERYSSMYDVIANSIGATIGVMAAVLLRAAVRARDEQVIARHEALRAASWTPSLTAVNPARKHGGDDAHPERHEGE